MREIPLSRGQVALVDDEDYEYLMQWKWCARWSRFSRSYYAITEDRYVNRKRGKSLLMHRVVLGLQHKDGKMVDHINHNTIDNRRVNLRLCTRSQNAANERLRRTNSSGYKGVYFDRESNKYAALIRPNGKRHFLGRFTKAEDAGEAYRLAAKKYYGDYVFEGGS